MTVERITISVPEDVAGRIRRAAADTSVSAWVTGLIEERLDEAELERLWSEFYAAVKPRREDVRRADALFDRLTRKTSKPRKKRAA